MVERISDLIDLEAYPLNDAAGDGYRALLSETRAALDRDGCAVLKSFVRPEAIASLTAEAEIAAPHAHRSYNKTNVYFTQDDPSLPPSHPARQFYPRSNAFIPADNFRDDSLLRRIYEWPALTPFIQAALREESFFPYADPLADVIVNMADEGAGFPWHFDTNNYTVTLAIQNAHAGGAFEYAPNLRRDGENFEGVAAVLAETSDAVRVLHLEPGDLQIFKGRYSLHRVAPLSGSRRRYVAIFSYAERPDMVGSVERTRQLYGRVLPIHEERAGLRGDTFID
jgi:hypothetical protein